MLSTLAVIVIALILDHCLGEPKRFHPLLGFGYFASKLEQLLNQNLAPTKSGSTLLGMLAWLSLVIPAAILLHWFYLQLNSYGQLACASLILYLAIARRALFEHATAVASASENSLVDAKVAVAKIVSRDTAAMEQADINRAVIESTLENGSDSLIAPLFWFLLGGVAAVVVYRAANTLDAMWGYKNPRFRYFGCFAAKADDVLNYIPARITALAYCFMGDYRQGRECWQRQAKHCASPNGGPVMCAGAGALSLKLGGNAYYHGELQQRSEMGIGQEPAVADIRHCTQLIDRSVVALLALLALVALLQC